MNEDRPGKGSGFSKEFREHTQELGKWKKEKRDVYNMRETKDAMIGDLQREKDKLLKLCHPVYNIPEDLERCVKKLNREIETSTLST